tara:strand:+ start:253 stop:705 length:453 start_codon:yes stop_codon:yes gene_type:complete
MKVNFREIDPFNCWIWLNFLDIPNQAEKNYLDAVFESWYVIGRLGGFNSENLQVHEQGNDLSWMNYEDEESSNIIPALMHNLGEIEYNQKWARCWVDLGTCDSIAIDILVNSLKQVDKDFVELKKIYIGGVNEDWPIEDHPDSVFESIRK